MNATLTMVFVLSTFVLYIYRFEALCKTRGQSEDQTVCSKGVYFFLAKGLTYGLGDYDNIISLMPSYGVFNPAGNLTWTR